MSETTKKTAQAEIPVEVVEPEAVEVTEAEVEVVEKPYTFRLLGAPDIFLMSKIIKTIGVKEFKACFESDGIKNMIQNVFMDAKKENPDEEPDIVTVGMGVALEIADVILGNLYKCEEDIYKMLSNVSNLSVDEIKAPGNAVMFLEMVIDFFKKEEFKDFFKVVSKLF